MKHIASTTKKFLAASGLAFGLASLGMFANAGIAAADHPTPDAPVLDAGLPAAIDANGTQEMPDTGSSDEVLALAQEQCWKSGTSSGCEQERLSGSYGDYGTVESSWPGGNAKP